MKKIIPTLAILLFILPSVSSAAALTAQQSTSLIAVVQSSPGTPASAFVSLITAFSNITAAQASSLITVVQSAPGVPANAFVNLLTSFTVDTPAVQPATQTSTTQTNQQTTQSVTPPTPTSTSTLPTTKTFKLLITEFVPADIKYTTFHFCSDGRITHTADGINYSKYPDCNSLEKHDFLEVINNPKFIFNPPITLLNNQYVINPRSYFYINEYLRKEALKYDFNNPPQFTLDIKGPFPVSVCPPTAGAAFSSPLVDFNFFKDQLQSLNIQTSGYDFIAVTFIDDYGLSLNNCPRYANQAFVGDKFVFTTIDSAGIGNEYHIQSLTHELMHQFGVSDTYVPNRYAGGPDWCYVANGCAADPEGIPDPDNYPQTKGCLMVPDAQIVAIRRGISNLSSISMNQIVVCKKTAQEIGWTK